MHGKNRSRERSSIRPPQTGDEARELTRELLRAQRPGADEADVGAVLLGVSELVTNAVRHAGGVTDFRLEAGREGIAVEVSDASDRRPRMLEADPCAPGGFGWLLVRELASELTVTVRPGRGKTVRAVFPVRT
ncbi:ATP-binding protein [Streptomyces glaucosporus]|uniref:ATP-binding protein n=1 Tax=Streptomyces glaucosporus TaxID=284044 RepID=A0ABN3IDB0_9ACTN